MVTLTPTQRYARAARRYRLLRDYQKAFAEERKPLEQYRKQKQQWEMQRMRASEYDWAERIVRANGQPAIATPARCTCNHPPHVGRCPCWHAGRGKLLARQCTCECDPNEEPELDPNEEPELHAAARCR